MFIFLIISASLIFGIHKSVMKSVDNYGYGAHEEWREFEKQFQYEDAVRF